MAGVSAAGRKVKGDRWRRAVLVWCGARGIALQTTPLGHPGDDLHTARAQPVTQTLVALTKGRVEAFPAGSSPLLLSIECKAHETLHVPEWLRQAEASAQPGELPIVIAKRPGSVTVDDSYVVMTGRGLGQLLERLTEDR